MSQIVQGRTVIIIAHRLAALRNCDRIIALNNGRVVEDGSHSDLVLRPNGFYSQLWRMQTENSES
jgi:subfamily B ATP-binding cassette protein HlyB/CyaB